MGPAHLCSVTVDLFLRSFFSRVCMPSVGSSVAIVTAAASTCLLGVSAGHETGFMGLGMPEGEDRNPPEDGDDGRESDGGDCEESGLAVAEVGSVEFSRGWTHDELSELVREGRNLALNAQSSVGTDVRS